MKNKKNRNICYICYRRFPDTNFQSYSKTVSENGYDVTVLAFLDKNQKKCEILGKRKIIRISLPGDKRSKKSIFAFLIKTYRILKQHNFAIIHIHHTCKFFIFFKIFAPFDYKFIFHITSYFSSIPIWKSFMKRLFIYFQCLFMDKVILQSFELKYNWIGIRKLKKAIIIPIGYDRKIFHPITKKEKYLLRQTFNLREEELVSVYCGAISKLRKLDRMVEAFKIVLEKVSNARFLIIGDGDALEILKAQVSQLGIGEKVFFTGRIIQKKVAKYIAMADIGISYIPINEKYNYNPPLKTFEYMACGLPSIATATVSNSKIIKDGYNGILINDSVHQVAEAIVNLMKDANLRNTLSTNASNSVITNDFDRITKTQLIPLYEKLF